MLLQLSAELCDHIMDLLHDDKVSLFACGLTCKSWLPCSRYHLFSDVTVYPANGKSLTDLLAAPSNNIAPVLQHLTLALEPEDPAIIVDRRDVELKRGQSTELLMMIPDITSCCRVKSLALRRLYWCLHTSEHLQLILSNLNEVKTLELTLVTVRGIGEVMGVICAFPRLECLSLDRLSWDQYPLYSQTFVAKYPRRQHPLVIKFLNLLHTIQLPHVVFNDFTPELLESAGASIQKLEINFKTIYVTGDTLPIMDISPCPNIRSLRFRWIALTGSLHFRFIVPILSKVSSPYCEQVSFEFWGANDKAFDADSEFDWKRLAEVLLRQFANLKRVCVQWVLTYSSRREDLEAFFAEGPFSPITKQGLLQLTFLNPISTYRRSRLLGVSC